MTTCEIIEKKLTEELKPLHLEIHDDSDKHRGHMGYVENVTTHVNIIIVSEAFEGIPMIKQHRLINELLAEEFENGLHALALKTIKPSKWNK